jgi:hypothetical protein
MSSVILTGDTSGTLTVSAPLVAGSNTLTLAAATGTLSPLVSGTAVASTSGTSIDFTGIPSWVKRITVMFSGVSTNGTSLYLVQIGAGSVQTSGYVAGIFTTTSTAGFPVTYNFNAATTQSGLVSINNITSNTWVSSGIVGITGGNQLYPSFGTVSLSGTLDRIRITTVNGTDTFDAGSVNIMYE